MHRGLPLQQYQNSKFLVEGMDEAEYVRIRLGQVELLPKFDVLPFRFTKTVNAVRSASASVSRQLRDERQLLRASLSPLLVCSFSQLRVVFPAPATGPEVISSLSSLVNLSRFQHESVSQVVFSKAIRTQVVEGSDTGDPRATRCGRGRGEKELTHLPLTFLDRALGLRSLHLSFPTLLSSSFPTPLQRHLGKNNNTTRSPNNCTLCPSCRTMTPQFLVLQQSPKIWLHHLSSKTTSPSQSPSLSPHRTFALSVTSRWPSPSAVPGARTSATAAKNARLPTGLRTRRSARRMRKQTPNRPQGQALVA